MIVGSRTGAPALGSGRLLQCFRTGPQFGCHRHVSSPLHVKRSMRISRTALPCGLLVMGYETDLARSAFGTLAPTPPLPAELRLRLDVYPSPQVLQTNGRLCHVVLAFHVVKGVTTQQGPIAPSALPNIIATAGPSATLSPSTNFPVSPVIGSTFLPTISHRGKEGFSSCLACLCQRAVASTPVSYTHLTLPTNREV